MEKQDGSCKSDENVPARATWSSPTEFILSCMGFAIGLGNVWRFPYLCYKNGGGAFLIAYFTIMLLMGLPIFFLELVVGQYSRVGPSQAFARLAPIFSGLGYCTLVVTTLNTIYYMVIVAWGIFYFSASFSSELGWGLCSNDFNTENCYSAERDNECREINEDETFWKGQCEPVQNVCHFYGYNYSDPTHCFNKFNNETVSLSQVITDRVLSSEEYLNNYVLGVKDATWENFGPPRWQLVLCLLCAWTIAFGCVVKGIKSSGKAMYFTALFPYIVLLALLIRGSTLDGAKDGVLLYIVPKFERLLDPGIWGNAASQTFFSVGIAYGSLITLSSYSDFKNNCHKDVLIVTAINSLTSVFAGFSIFTVLGFLAHQMDAPVESVARDGPGLAFVVYPEAVLQMPLPQLWSFLFFLMLCTLGLGSQFAGIEAVNTAIIDKWPKLRSRRGYVALGNCVICFLLGLPMCCNGGLYLFSLLEWNTASWAVFLIGLAEVGSVAWCYGCNRFLNDIAKMGMKLSKFTTWYWKICWVVLTPVALIGVFAFTLSNFTSASLNGYVFPEWANVIGWMISLSTLAPLIIFALVTLYMRKYTGWNLLKPTSKWGPKKDDFDSMDDTSSQSVTASTDTLVHI